MKVKGTIEAVSQKTHGVLINGRWYTYSEKLDFIRKYIGQEVIADVEDNKIVYLHIIGNRKFERGDTIQLLISIKTELVLIRSLLEEVINRDGR